MLSFFMKQLTIPEIRVNNARMKITAGIPKVTRKATVLSLQMSKVFTMIKNPT